MTSGSDQDFQPIVGVVGDYGRYRESRYVVPTISMLRASGATPLFLGDRTDQLHEIFLKHGWTKGKNLEEKMEIATKFAEADIKKFHAVIFEGSDPNHDPDDWDEPLKGYEYRRDHKEGGRMPDSRRCYEIALMRMALKEKIPVMGICSGMQRLNLIDNRSLLEEGHRDQMGNIIQHIPDTTAAAEANGDYPEHIGGRKHNGNIRGLENLDGKPLKKGQGYVFDKTGWTGTPEFTPVHFIGFAKGSMCHDEILKGVRGLYAPDHHADIGAEGFVLENSIHNQALGRIQPNFRPVGFSADGIVEAIEPSKEGKYKDQFVIGLQFHPEFGASQFGRPLFSRFVHEADQYAHAAHKEDIRTSVKLPRYLESILEKPERYKAEMSAIERYLSNPDDRPKEPEPGR